MRDELERAIRSFNEGLPEVLKSGRKRPRAETPRQCARALLRDIALEERAIGLSVENAADSELVVLATSVDSAAVAATSFCQLLCILQDACKVHPLAYRELRAPLWWFERWTAAPVTERDQLDWWFRQCEFSFFDRKMLCLDDQTLAAAAAKLLPKNALTSRQRALIDGVSRGVCGIFAVRQRRSQTMLLEHLETGAHYEIREHPARHTFDESCILLGRLIQLPEIGWIRSPGSIYWSGDEEGRSTLARVAQAPKPDQYPSILVELVIAAIFGERDLPRRIPPAESPSDARFILNPFPEMTPQADSATARLPEIALEMGVPDLVRYLEMSETPVDEVLKAWLDALREQADLASPRWGADHDAKQSRHRDKGEPPKYRRQR